MIDADDFHPLSQFLRNSKPFIERLRRTRRPEVLTVNGKAAIVIQDAAAYAAMAEALDQAALVESLRVGLEQFKAGKGIPLAEFDRQMKAKYGAGFRRR